MVCTMLSRGYWAKVLTSYKPGGQALRVASMPASIVRMMHLAISPQTRNLSGPEIRRHRMAKGLSQDQLAARLQIAGLEHMDRVVVAKMESQIRSVFDWELAVIADVLGAEVSDFLPGKRKIREELPDLVRGKKD